MQHCLDRVSGACDDYGLTTIKTETMLQPALGEDYISPEFTVNGRQKLPVADKFTQLDSMLSDCIQIDEEVSSRISKASVAFSRLMNNQQTNEQSAD